jgi:hypothetical protein
MSNRPIFALSLRLLAIPPEGTMELFQPAPADFWPIPPDVARQLAITFGLTVTDVRADARDVVRWHGPSEGLLTSIGARRRLGVQSAATYLQDLRAALTSRPRDR